MSAVFDIVILGGGLAGLSLADALDEADHSVCVLEKETIGSGASGTPGGLVNLATGRRGRKVWRAEECYRAIRDNLEKTAPLSPAPFFWQQGVLRPALTEKMARKMREQFDSTSWKPELCRWLDREQILEKHPGITCTGGGLWLEAGMAVDVPSYLTALADNLRDRGVEILQQTEASLSPAGDRWIFSASGMDAIICRRVIFATGRHILDSPWWSALPMEPVKGQVAVFESDRPCGFDHSVSSLGYIARLGNPRRFVMGSTYEHDFDHPDPDEEGEEYLRARLRRTLPDLESRSRIVEQWAGVRMSSSDYMPILGKHAGHDGLYCFTGLGSKGLLYSKYLAELFAAHLETGEALPEEVDTARFT